MINENGQHMPGAGKAKSGSARMAALTPSERGELARKAALSRWTKNVESPPKRTLCGSEESPLRFGGVEVHCYVLEDETRIITLDGMKAALGISLTGTSARLGEFLAILEPNSTTANELATKLQAPVRFWLPPGRKIGYGYPSAVMVDICESLLEARHHGTLTDRFAALATRAELLVRGYARVGLDALIDEATGFQKFRSRTALVELLSRYLSSRLLEWTKTFPDEFYTEMFRLKEWDFSNLQPGDPKPALVGRYTRNIIYERMPVPVIQHLETVNPVTRRNGRSYRHHQFLTRDIGHPELKSHIEKVLMLMQLSTNWEDFRSKLRKVMPKKWEQYQFADLLPDPADAPPNYSEDGLD